MNFKLISLTLLVNLLLSLNSSASCLENYSLRKNEMAKIISESGYQDVIKTSEMIVKSSIISGFSLVALSMLDGGASLFGSILAGGVGGTSAGRFLSIPIVHVYREIKLQEGIEEIVDEHLLLEESTVFMNAIINRDDVVLNPLMAEIWLNLDHKITKEQYIQIFSELNAKDQFCSTEDIASPEFIHSQIYEVLEEIHE